MFFCCLRLNILVNNFSVILDGFLGLTCFLGLTSTNAPVICYHDLPAPGNSRDFDFLSSKTLPKSPHCGDSQLVKPPRFSPAVCNFFITLPLFLTQIPGISPSLRGQCKSKSTAHLSHFHGYPPGLGAVVTNDYCISNGDKVSCSRTQGLRSRMCLHPKWPTYHA